MKVNIEIELDDELWGEYKEGINPELFLEDLFSNWDKDGVGKVTLKSIDNEESINVNRLARVVLTETGAKVVNDHIKNDETIRLLSEDQIKTLFGQNKFKSGDTYKSSLWDIMNIFGKSMYMGCDVPFYHNEITLL
jgi:hypothetical protein